MSRIKTFFKDFIIPILIGLIIAKIITTFFIQFNIVNGQSMEPTLQHQDYLVSEKVTYRFKNPDRGDIVITKLPNEEKHIIKRVIGLPGETVTLIPRNNETSSPSQVLINGKLLKEDYLGEEMNIPTKQEFVIEEGKVFLLGDNRNNSSDSRIFGYFNISELDGKVFLEITNNFKLH